MFQLNPVALTLLFPGLISVTLALYSFNVRRVPGSKVFAFAMLATSLWSLAYCAELSSLSLDGMLLITPFGYLGIATLPIFWLILTLIYTGHRQWITRPYMFSLFIIPFLTLIFVSTNQFHHIFYNSVSLDTSGPFPKLFLSRGVWFWVNSGYSYAAILLSIGLLLKKLFFPQPVYRPQIIALLAGVLVPVTVNILYLAFGISFYRQIDPTPFAFIISGFAITWGIARYRLFNLVPIARDHIIESMDEGVIVVDLKNNLEDTNLASRRIFGWNKSDIGKSIGLLMQNWPDIVDLFRSSINNRLEITRSIDANKNYFEINISTLFDNRKQPIGRLAIVRDITERKILEQKLERMATHDSLTGLPARVLLNDRLSMALARASRKNSKLAVIMIDLDHFKFVNDTFGHRVGDQLLIAVSAKLRNMMRKNDTISRIGGDEFVILLPEINTIDEAAGAAERILLAFQSSLNITGYNIRMSLSLGISIFPENGDNIETLLENADSAMYQAKKRGRNRYEIYLPVETTKR
jgi:diguanylate cyclase (GGDEF)-like protein/PAS domain S-box-containing protein